MKSLSFCVLTLMSLNTAAFAGESPYEVLKNYYEASSQPASVEDIDLYYPSVFPPTNQECVWVPTERSPVQPFVLFRNENVLIPGEPYQGPLFPGTPDRIVDQCLLWSGRAYAPEFCRNQTMSITDLDLVVTVPKVFENSAHTMSFRKTGDVIPFQALRVGSNSDGELVDYPAYGYCYPRQ